MPVCSRPWRRLEIECLKSQLSTSRLCQPEAWPADIDEMALLYDDEMNMLLDQSLPARQFLRRPRPSDPWFNSECRQAKRLTRRLERASVAAGRWAAEFPTDAVAASSAAAAKETGWYSQRRVYSLLRHRKSSEFWRSKFETDQSDQESCGDQWTSYSDVAVFLRVLLSTSRRSTVFSLKRSRKYGPARKMHHRLLSVQRELG